tara:strand:- start:963 stop:1580 length:618 start_codon:yes stop_codon:yes gene_type:complete
MNDNMTTEKICEMLQCGICLETATLPVHPTCCEKSKSMNPGCLFCVRKYHELNIKPDLRINKQKSWSGCGCTIYPRIYIKGRLPYEHTYQLDMIRNMLGKSKCHHQNCQAEFDTCAELRRHLTGQSNETDKFGNCKYAITKCNKCNYYGERWFVEGPHKKKYHSQIWCNICNKYIIIDFMKSHYDKHKLDLKVFKSTINTFLEKG